LQDYGLCVAVAQAMTSAFAYKSLDEIDFTGVFWLSFEEVTAKDLATLDATERWINNMGMGLSLEDVFPDHD
jgi:hypothetical protein